MTTADGISLDAVNELRAMAGAGGGVGGGAIPMLVIDVSPRRARGRYLRCTIGDQIVPAKWYRQMVDMGLVREFRLDGERRERGYRGFELSDKGRRVLLATAGWSGRDGCWSMRVEAGGDVVVVVDRRACRAAENGRRPTVASMRGAA